MTTINHNGSRINKVHFQELETLLQESSIDFNVDAILNEVCGMDDYAYVSCGFLYAIESEGIDVQEWHHYFKKDGLDFRAHKLNFYINI
jgi:hypothetical protein